MGTDLSQNRDVTLYVECKPVSGADTAFPDIARIVQFFDIQRGMMIIFYE